jgi:hypothetical protein
MRSHFLHILNSWSNILLLVNLLVRVFVASRRWYLSRFRRVRSNDYHLSLCGLYIFWTRRSCRETTREYRQDLVIKSISKRNAHCSYSAFSLCPAKFSMSFRKITHIFRMNFTAWGNFRLWSFITKSGVSPEAPHEKHLKRLPSL